MKKSLLALVLGAAAVAAATAAEPEWVNAVVVKADAQRSRVTLRATEPLSAAEPNRPRLPQLEGFAPLSQVKRPERKKEE